ncbi:MAG: hypothetical protein HOO67_07975 [Candidatus Peribacteraceae bacterium]|nr:hypothetical protein [Candidatus Peribacteraceae bacterium]
MHKIEKIANDVVEKATSGKINLADKIEAVRVVAIKLIDAEDLAQPDAVSSKPVRDGIAELLGEEIAPIVFRHIKIDASSVKYLNQIQAVYTVLRRRIDEMRQESNARPIPGKKPPVEKNLGPLVAVPEQIADADILSAYLNSFKALSKALEGRKPKRQRRNGDIESNAVILATVLTHPSVLDGSVEIPMTVEQRRGLENFAVDVLRFNEQHDPDELIAAARALQNAVYLITRFVPRPKQAQD